MGIWRLTALMGWRCFLLIHRFLDGSVWRLIIALYDGFWYPSLFVGWFSLHFFRGFSFFNCLWVAFEKRWYSFMYFFIFILLLSLHFFTPFTLIFFLPSFYGCMEGLFLFHFFSPFHIVYFFFSSGMETEWMEGRHWWIGFCGVFFFSFIFYFLPLCWALWTRFILISILCVSYFLILTF